MFYPRQVTAFPSHQTTVLLLAFILFSFSCIIPKNYQAGKPFVFKTNIKINGSLPNDERQNLELKLTNQLDDSLRARTVTAFMSLKPFAPVYKKLANPPVFDSINLNRSKAFMVSLLNSVGYYAPLITDSFSIDTIKHQLRTTISFRVNTGKNMKMDSVGFSLTTPALQQLALASRKESVLKKGRPYSKQIVSTEIDRLVNIFRNNGYYKVSSKDIYAEVDTVLAGLIDPALDPFQQAQLLEDLKKKKQEPTITIVIKQRAVTDSISVEKFYIDKITIYPDLQLLEDSTIAFQNDTVSKKGITIISRYNKFNTGFLAKNVYLLPGKKFNQDNYYRTLNQFSTKLGAWQNAAIDIKPSEKSDTLLDAVIRLYPQKKLKLSINPEASYNTNDILASNLFGVDLNLGLLNRNAFKQSVQTTTNLRGGVEFGSRFIATQQLSLSHNIYFPKRIPNIKSIDDSKYDNLRTSLSLNASYTKRDSFFTVKSINAAWGWEWSRTNKERKSTKSYLVRFPNIEYANLTKTDSFSKYLASIPSLIYAFKTGFIVGTQFIYSSIKQNGNHTNFLRMTAEESGTLLGLIPALDTFGLFRFVKADIEFRHHIDYKKSQLAMRIFGGAGVEYGGGQQVLPFYKAYFGGGPGFVGASSMRGWQVRQLGLGSSKFYDYAPSNLLDRFGDIQIEANLEYRFPLGSILGEKIYSAFYTDIGNIWDRHKIDTSSAAQGSDFNIGRFYKEFAVDAGTGLRVDFGYFVIRLDWAYKIRDPQRLTFADHWFYKMHLIDGQFQLGVNYPF